MKNNKAFTLIELIVVISIIWLLATIWIISYSSKMVDARNFTRISDMSNIKISLQNHKLKNSLYPNIIAPYIEISNSWSIIKQWFLDDTIHTIELTNKPLDPMTKKPYIYSISSNRLFFQVWISLENNTVENIYKLQSYIDGDFVTSSNDVIWMIFASNQSWVYNPWNIVLNWSTLNIPYNRKWEIIQINNDINEIINENWVSYERFCGFYSCQEIYENWMYFWPWNYCMLDENWNLIEYICW